MYRICNWNSGAEKMIFVVADSLGEAFDKFLTVSGIQLKVLSSQESPDPFFTPNEIWFEMQNGHRFMVSKVD